MTELSRLDQHMRECILDLFVKRDREILREGRLIAWCCDQGMAEIFS